MTRLANKPTQAQRVESAEKQAMALQLRKAGLSFSKIATQLGCNKATACRYVLKSLEEFKVSTREDAEELLRLELARLDGALAAVWPKVVAANLGAIDRLVKIMDRRAKYLGLDAPTKVAPTSPDGVKEWGGGGGLAALLDQIKQDESSGHGGAA